MTSVGPGPPVVPAATTPAQPVTPPFHQRRLKQGATQRISMREAWFAIRALQELTLPSTSPELHRRPGLGWRVGEGGGGKGGCTPWRKGPDRTWSTQPRLGPKGLDLGLQTRATGHPSAPRHQHHRTHPLLCTINHRRLGTHHGKPQPGQSHTAATIVPPSRATWTGVAATTSR
jgi:hypothetical protein